MSYSKRSEFKKEQMKVASVDIVDGQYVSVGYVVDEVENKADDGAVPVVEEVTVTPVDPNQALKEQMAAEIDSYRAAGINPAHVFAFETTGILLTHLNAHLVNSLDQARWEAAMNTYHAEQHRMQAGV